LYDIREDKEIQTYTFNMGTQSPFGYIFIISITIGALSLTVIVGYIYVSRIFKKSKI